MSTTTALPPPPPPPTTRWGLAWRIGLACLIGLVAWVLTASVLPPGVSSATAAWFTIGDAALGLLAVAIAARGRRRRPLATAALVTVLSAFSAAAAGATAWTLGSVATRRRWRELAWLAPLNLAAGISVEVLYPDVDGPVPWYAVALIGSLYVGIVVAVGLAVGSRRELIASLRQRAETAEREQQARVDSARSSERTRIAREMHDVLAHRITLVAMHAGALSYRTDLSPEEQATAARTIEHNAHLALKELREVLGVLRLSDRETDAVEAPQPRATDVARLVEETRAAGLRVTLEDTTAGEPPATAGRTAYRVVQEGLTNAGKHAPGTHVVVSLTGAPGEGLTVRIDTPRPVGTIPTVPGAGLGLLGLRERVSLAGGRLEHGTEGDGGHRLEAWLPWEP